MKRIWIIGHGFLGSALAVYLRVQGHEVYTIDRDSSAQADTCGDASDPSFWAQSLTRNTAPDIIICAQATSGGDAIAYENCYLGIVRACISHSSSQIIFCSSTSVCGIHDGSLVDESRPIEPKTPRARILREAEELVLAQGQAQQGIVLRLGALYGGDRLELWRRYEQGIMPVAGARERWMNYTLREQALTWIASLIAQEKTGLYHLVSDRLTKQEALELMQELTGLDIPSEESVTSSRRGGSNQQVISMHPEFMTQGYDCMRQWILKKRKEQQP